jgi:cell division protease FtsH
MFDEVSTGAHDDLSKSTDIARSMVKEFGMSEKLGQITFEKERRSMFLEVAPGFSSRDYSDETAREIDNEMKRIVENMYNLVKSTLTANRDLLETVAKTLLEKEVLEGEELRRLIKEDKDGHDQLEPREKADRSC